MGRLIRFGDPDSPLFEFRKRQIVSITDDKQTTLIGEELKIDTLTPVVRFTVIQPEPLIDSEGVPLVDSLGAPLVAYGTGDLRLLPHGTKVTLYEVYGDEETLKAVYFVDDVERIAKDQYQINCMSIIGRLQEQKFVGRRFINEPLHDVISDLLGDIVPDLIVFSPYLVAQRVSNFIPNCTRREALYHLMLAYGIGLMSYGDVLYFRPVGEIGNAEVIPDDRIYINGKVTYPSPPSSVQVTAHYWDYDPGEAVGWEEHVVFDNTATMEPANNDLVTVDFLYFAYRIETVSSDALYTDFDVGLADAQFSPGEFHVIGGIGKLVLISPPRIDTIYELINPDAEVERVISVTDEMLISPYNAPNVARRLMDYYKNGKIIEQAIILDQELCGNMYEFDDAFDEHETAAMTSMQTVYSGVTKANCRLVAGINPAIDFPYTNYSRYDQDQTIDLSALKARGIREIGILLVGGGQAGFDGGNGEAGENTEPPASGDFILRGGKGGRGGRGGNGGKTKFVQLDITNITSLTLTVGAGGTANGEEGGVTAITYTESGVQHTIDSDDGESFAAGTINPLSGESVGERGNDGVSGGDGGNSGRIWAAKVLNSDWSYSGGAVDAAGIPMDVSETVSAESGHPAKVGSSVLVPAPGLASSGNYGTNIIMYYGGDGNVDIYYSIGGAGGGGTAYEGFATSGEAVYG